MRVLYGLETALLLVLLASIFFLQNGYFRADDVLVALSAASAAVSAWLFVREQTAAPSRTDAEIAGVARPASPAGAAPLTNRMPAWIAAVPAGVWLYAAYLAAVLVAFAFDSQAPASREVLRQLCFVAVIGSMAHAARRAPALWLGGLVLGLALIVVQILGPRSVTDHFGRAYHYQTIVQWSGYPEIGLLACLGVAATGAVLLTTPSWRLRAAAALLALGFAVAPVYLYSRFAVVTVIVVAAWLPFALLLRARRRVAIVLVIVASLAATVAIVRPGGVRQRVEGGITAGAWETGIRAEGWRVAAMMMRNGPWFGIGPGRYQAEYASYSTRYDNTHAYNLLMHTGAELGLFGLVCYVLLWGRVLWRSLKTAARSPIGMVALATHGMLVAFFVRSQSEHFLANLDASFRLLLLVGVLFGIAESVSSLSPTASESTPSPAIADIPPDSRPTAASSPAPPTRSSR